MERPSEEAKYFSEFQLASQLEKSDYEDPKTGQRRPFIGLKKLRQELEDLPRGLCSTQCINFIEHLLVVDHSRRPTAEHALKHPFLQGL